MIRYFLFSWLVFSVSFSAIHAAVPADISFIVIDLKYNSNDGVKICELQQGLMSAFEGVAFIEGRNKVMAEKVAAFITDHYDQYWFVEKKLSGEMKVGLKENPQGKSYRSLTKLLKNKKVRKLGRIPAADPRCLSSYQGVILGSYKCLDPDKLKKVKGLLVQDSAFLPYFGQGDHADKNSVNKIFDKHEVLRKLRPAWGLYPKQYSAGLVDTILSDLSSEYLVIKPQKGFQGRGVIILHRSDLEETLQLILENPSQLKRNSDKAYNWWAHDRDSHFLVEEFIPSDPVYASHLSDFPFDGTMRAAIMLTFDRETIGVHFLYLFWKLPKKSLGEEGSLNDKHKSFSQSEKHYSALDEETEENVKAQLEEGLLLLYADLLGK